MNTSKLVKQLKKELTRNTKKTVALALVSLVALWFWAPLAYKWVAGDAKKKKSRQAAIAAAASADANAAAADAAAKPEVKQAPQFHWNEYLEKISNDPLMTTARLPRDIRDPFGATPLEKQAIATAPQASPGAPSVARASVPVQIDPSPEDVGLKLEATLVLGTARRAVISGVTYRQGDRVRLSAVTGTQNNASAATETTGEEPVTFQLKQVEAKQIVLTRGDKEYTLKLKQETLDDRDQLTFGAAVSATAQP